MFSANAPRQGSDMDDLRLAAGFRAARIRRGWRQEDVASRAGLSRTTVARLELGQLDGVPLRVMRSVARALELQLDVTLRWRGSELARLLDAAHAAMHDEIERVLTDAGGWTPAPEVSFSVFGERGVIDVLAWHAATRTILVIELKTLLVDVSDLLGTMDRRRRLALRIGDERGWRARTAATWVVLAATSTNRRRVHKHRLTLRRAFPATGPTMRRWLREPAGSIDALSFLPYVHQANATAGRLRVRSLGRGHSSAR
jgi:transcriptional regulator with XRE-family HTH domain